MTANTMFRCALVAATFLLTACSDILDGPTEEDLSNQLAFELPVGYEVRSIDILVSENTGSEVEPSYRQRSTATLRLIEDRVELVKTLDDKFILKKVFDEGTEFDVTVISSSRLVNNKWNVTLDKLEGRTITGLPLSQFIEGTYAYEGTSEAEKLASDYEAKLKAEAEAAAAEAERKRLEAEAALAKAEADKVARIKAFREFLAGTWLTKTPVLRNGAPFLTRDNESAGMEITFEPGEGAAGKALVTLFVNEDIVDKVAVNANFSVSDSGEFATLFLRTRTNHRRLNWTFNENWTFDKNGLLQTRTGRTRWHAEMEKDGAALDKKRAEEARLIRREEAIQALRQKHKAFLGDRRLRDIGLNSNTWGPVYVDAEKSQKGDVYGNAAIAYGENSSVLSAALHAGVIAEGESAILKVTRQRVNRRSNIDGTLSNGIQSQSFNQYTVYKIELIEKLELN